MSLAETYTQVKQLIVDNLTAKGVEATLEDGLTTLANKILEIPSVGGFDVITKLSLTIDSAYEETFSALQTNYIFHLTDTKNINASTILKDEEENGIEDVVISLMDENNNVIGKNITDNNGESLFSFDMGDDDKKSIKAVTKNLETDIETFYYTYKDTKTAKFMLVWNDDNNSSNKRPSSVSVCFMRDGVDITGAIPLNEANDWQVTREYPLDDEYGYNHTYEWRVYGVSGYFTRTETYNNLTIGISNIIEAPPAPSVDDGEVPPLPEDIPEIG